MLKTILNYIKQKEEIIKTFLKALLASVPGGVIFFLSYTHPALLSFSLVWQVVLPIIAAATCLISGYEYLFGCFRSFKTICISMYQALLYKFKKEDKDKNKNKEQSFFSVLVNLDMNVLVSLSIIWTAIYVAFLGMAAPIVIYTAPMLTLAALQFSKLFKILINQWVNKSAQIKLDLLRKKYSDLKNEIQKIRKGAIITLTPNERSGFKTFIPVSAKLLSPKAAVSGGTYITGEKEKINDYQYEQVIPGGTYYIGKEPITLEAQCDGLESHHYKLVEELLNKTENVSFTDKLINMISAGFVPTVLSIAAISFIIWSIVSGPVYGFTVMLDILFAACPCALGIAAIGPISLLKAVLFNKNIALHNEKAITQLPEFNTIVFDKTGTLTQLKLSKINIISKDKNTAEAMSLILACIAHAEKVRLKDRPFDSFASAIIQSEEFSKIDIPQELKKQLVIDSSKHDGLEVSLTESNAMGIRKVYTGSALYMRSLGLDVDSIPGLTCSDGGSTNIYIVVEQNGVKSLVSTASFTQKLRDDAKDTITCLQKSGVTVYMLTGDNLKAAQVIAESTGIPLDNIQAECSVEGEGSKAAYVKKLIAQQRKVLVVGDGWNDLDAAKIANAGSIAMGIHSDMGGKFDITIEELSDILKLKPIFKSAQMIQQQVFAFSILYNLLAIFLAAVIFPMAGMVTMMGCFGICMAFSSLFAVAWSSLIVPMVYKKLGKTEQEGTSKEPVVNSSPDGVNTVVHPSKASCSLPQQTEQRQKTDISEYKICNPKPIGLDATDNPNLYSLDLTIVIRGRCAGCYQALNQCKTDLQDRLSKMLELKEYSEFSGTVTSNLVFEPCGTYKINLSVSRFFCSDRERCVKQIRDAINQAGLGAYNPCITHEIKSYYPRVDTVDTTPRSTAA